MLTKLTKKGVCYKIEDSPYKYNNGSITFYFSSNFYLTKFMDEMQENRDNISFSLSNRFNIHIMMENFADCILYAKIEKRGFYLEDRNGVYRCLNKVKFLGDNLNNLN